MECGAEVGLAIALRTFTLTVALAPQRVSSLKRNQTGVVCGEPSGRTVVHRAICSCASRSGISLVRCQPDWQTPSGCGVARAGVVAVW